MTMLPFEPYRNILLPLDGSRLAEAILPAAVQLARRFNSTITLLHILEQNPPATIHGEKHLNSSSDAGEYLRRVAATFENTGIAVTMHVHEAREGDIAASIAEHTDELGPDLIALCAHGKHGLHGFFRGAIGLQALQHGKRPIFLTQPAKDGSAPSFQPDRIIVPIDGEHKHEEALRATCAFAKVFDAEVHLALVIPTLDTLSGDRAVSGMLLPSTTRAILDLREEEGNRYLAELVDSLSNVGIRATSIVMRGKAVDKVLKYAEKQPGSMIVMTSHGRTGLDAILSASVGLRIISGGSCPMLLVHADLDTKHVAAPPKRQ